MGKKNLYVYSLQSNLVVVPFDHFVRDVCIFHSLANDGFAERIRNA